MKVLKRALSLFIVGLFVFTAFAVIQSGGTNTASIHSVSSPTSILPYTTTSNGLTYTVESNGTYLWNGHYLRDPPVPYPKVPTIAPDGLPYGAVGTVGPVGQVGPSHFTRGTPSIIGISPSTVAGATTSITENSAWNNETLSILGNVTINAGVTLYINDSAITFDETPSTVSYSYGFTANYSASPPYSRLIIQDGSSITQSSSSDNTFYIVSYEGVGPHVFVSNTTINITSNTYPSASLPQDGSWYSINYLNYSAVNGPSSSVSMSQPFGDVTTYSFMTDTIVSSHSVFKNAYVIMGFSNTTFYNSEVYVMTDNMPDNLFTHNAFEFTNTTWSWIRSVGGEGTTWNLTNNIFSHVNFSSSMSYFSYYTIPIYSHNLTIVANNTFSDMWEGFPGVNGSITPLNAKGGSFIAEYDGSLIFTHNTIENLTFYNGAQFTPFVYVANYYSGYGTNLFPVSEPTVGSATASYNYVSTVTSVHKEEAGIYWFYARNTSILDNIEIGLHSPLSPGCTAWNGQVDNGATVYNVVSSFQTGWILYALTNNTNLTDANSSIVGNIDANVYGYSVLAQVFSGQAWISNNTFINLSLQAGGISIGGGSGSRYDTESGDKAYGVYNDSAAFGSPFGGLTLGETILPSEAYDIDTSSYAVAIVGAVNATISTLGQPVVITGDPSFQNANTGGWHSNATTVTLKDATIPVIAFYQQSTADGGTAAPNDFVSLNAKDFNVTVYNSYVPSNLTDSLPLSPGTNPSLLTLTGYLGIFAGQTYTLNASNIKNEASLPVYYSGNEIADIPASSAHYNFTAISQSEYSVSTTSAASPSVNLYFHGTPGLRYVVSIISRGGLFKSFVENATSTGIVNATYNPASMPLDPTFEVSPYVAPLPPYDPVQPNPPMNFFPAYVFYILLTTSAAGVAIGIYIMIRRR